ncbi:MAG: prolipoprotein diacylglyceryl transferase [Clostridia bacterium]|nr:prolipoprotein diacylglyceryl transferase [Clostridia bacterium]
MDVLNVTIFGLHLKLKPIAFTLPIGSGWSIYWYGILIATGFLLALIYAMKTAKRYNINTDRMLDVVLVTTPLAILGARSYYIIFDPVMTFRDFFDFSGAGFSGLAIYGGVIAAFAVGFIMCKISKIKILDMFDLAAIGFLIGQAVGRWGNFVNQEAFGAPTGSKWWGMTSQNVVEDFLDKGYSADALAHPCFLYESIWCFIGFLLLNHFSKNRKFSGQLILSYGVWYGFGRGFIELLRTDSLMLGALRVSSLLSFVVCIACGVLLFVFLKRSEQRTHEGDYDELFADETLSDDSADANEETTETSTLIEEEITDEQID